MRPVTYVDILSTKGQHFRLTVTVLAMASVLTVAHVVLQTSMDWQDLLLAGLLVGATFACVLNRKRWFGPKGQPLYQLRADDAGLTYCAGVSEWHWPWQDVLLVEYAAGRSRQDEEIRIDFCAAASDDIPAEMLWTGHGWQLRLLQTFDAPLREIAATLNRFRDRAVAGAT